MKKNSLVLVVCLAFIVIPAVLLWTGFELYPNPQADGPVKELKEFHITGMLLAVLVIIGAAKACGRLLGYFHQPPVMGEVIAGIILGPSVLGRLNPQLFTSLFPEHLVIVINYLAQFGMVLFMFLVGIEFDSRSLQKKTKETLGISLSSMATPFVLGLGFALASYEKYAPQGVSFLRFSLFLAAAMSVTAFPVLVRLVKDLRLEHHGFATLAISCAALDDALAWCLLAAVVSISTGSWTLVMMQIAGLGIFLVILYVVIRPFIALVERKAEHTGLKGEILPLMFGLVFVSSIVTEKLGVHALFGAFVLGSLVAKESRLAHEIQEKTSHLLNVIFIPLFFAHAGLKTQLGLLLNWEGLTMLASVLLLATLGKVGGTYLASTYFTSNRRDAWALSVLMNTRGLMEIIVLSVGLQMGIIDEFLFSVFLSMAIITTLLTSPLLRIILKQSPSSLGHD